MTRYLVTNSAHAESAVERLAPRGRVDVIDAAELFRSPPDDCVVALLQGPAGSAPELLRRLRSSPQTALLPILMQRAAKPLQAEQDELLADGTLSFTEDDGHFDGACAAVEALLPRLATLAPLPEHLTGAELRQLTLLRYLYSRSLESMEPVLHPASSKGYNLPLAALILGVESGEEFSQVAWLAELGLLRSAFRDRIHTCPYCAHYAINFREVCPTCRSPHLAVEENVHHFRCGHVAPEREYREGSLLMCPKCRRPLRHVGVDYDRPNQVAVCVDCHAFTTEPEVECLSLECGRVFSPGSSIKLDVNGYSLTLQGVAAAAQGVLPPRTLSDLLHDAFHTVRENTFREMVKLARGLADRYQRKYGLVRFAVANHQELSDNLGGAEMLETLKRLVEVLRGILRETDVLCPEGEHAFQVLFTETDRAGAERAVKRAEAEATERITPRVELVAEWIEEPE
jgi:CheY-like chemotaxis protein